MRWGLTTLTHFFKLFWKEGKAMRKGDKRLKYEDRKEIEKMKNDGVRVVVIAEKIGVHRATIYNELKRGGTPYRAEVAQKTI